MTPLFFSAACDFCEGRTPVEYHEGYVVYRGGRDGVIHQEYVFRSPEDADRFRIMRNLQDLDIRKVRSEEPFRWQYSKGTIKDLELADHLYAIFPDHRYEPGPQRAHVADA